MPSGCRVAARGKVRRFLGLQRGNMAPSYLKILETVVGMQKKRTKKKRSGIGSGKKRIKAI